MEPYEEAKMDIIEIEQIKPIGLIVKSEDDGNYGELIG